MRRDLRVLALTVTALSLLTVVAYAGQYGQAAQGVVLLAVVVIAVRIMARPRSRRRAYR